MIDRYIEWVYTLSGAERLMYVLIGDAVIIIAPFIAIAFIAVAWATVESITERIKGGEEE